MLRRTLVNQKNRDGTTPLMVACLLSNAAAAALLLEFGARRTVNARNGKRRSAADYAEEHGLWELAASLCLINDSVLGPLAPVAVPPGVTFAAVWQGHIGSAAASLYGADTMRSGAAELLTFWNRTRFFCAKWGSMRLLEGQLARRFISAGFDCSTFAARSTQTAPCCSLCTVGTCSSRGNWPHPALCGSQLHE